MQIKTQSPWVYEDVPSWFKLILDKAILSCMVLTALTVIICIHVCVSFSPSPQSIFPSCSDPVASVSVSVSEVPVHFTAQEWCHLCTDKGLTWAVNHKQNPASVKNKTCIQTQTPSAMTKEILQNYWWGKLLLGLSALTWEFVLSRKSFSKFISCLTSEAQMSMQEVLLFDRDKILYACLQFS